MTFVKRKKFPHTQKKSQRLIRYAYFAETCDLTDLLYMPRNKILSILIKEMSFNSRCMYTYSKYHRSVSHSTPQLQTITYRREKNLLKILCFCILYEKLQKNLANFETFLWSFSSSRNPEIVLSVAIFCTLFNWIKHAMNSGLIILASDEDMFLLFTKIIQTNDHHTLSFQKSKDDLLLLL